MWEERAQCGECGRHHPPPSLDHEVISRLLELRLAPPKHRVPGPNALLYYLHRDGSLLASGKRQREQVFY